MLLLALPVCSSLASLFALMLPLLLAV